MNDKEKRQLKQQLIAAKKTVHCSICGIDINLALYGRNYRALVIWMEGEKVKLGHRDCHSKAVVERERRKRHPLQQSRQW